MNMLKRIVASMMLILSLVFVTGMPVSVVHADPAANTTTTPAPEAGDAATGFLNGITFTPSSDGKTSGSLAVGVSGNDTNFNDIMNRYKNIIMFFTGILTITCFGAMILQITKLAAAGDNEQNRRKAIMGILTTGIGVALLGSATIVIGFFYQAISGSKG